MAYNFDIFLRSAGTDAAKKSLNENRNFRGIFVMRILEFLADENDFAYENFCRRFLPIEFLTKFNRQEPSHAVGVPNDSYLSKYHFETIVIDSFERTVNLHLVIFKGQLIEKRLSEINLLLIFIAFETIVDMSFRSDS